MARDDAPGIGTMFATLRWNTSGDKVVLYNKHRHHNVRKVKCMQQL